MKIERKSIIILCIYVIIMFAVCAFTLKTLKTSAPTNDIPNEDTQTIPPPVTEIVYIPIISEDVSDATSDTEIESETQQAEYLVKSYEGKIGIFTDNGTLIRVIDVYIKTLPKADRRLLEKGFNVTCEAELRAILQDYTG